MCTYVCMYISCEEFFYFLGDECFHIAFVLLDWVIRRSDNELRFLVFLFYSCIPDFQHYFCLTPWGHECSALPQCAEWAPALHSNLLGELGKGFAFACCPAISCSWDGFFGEFWCLQMGISCPDGWVGSGHCHVSAGEGRGCRSHGPPSDLSILQPLAGSWDAIGAAVCVLHWACGKVSSGSGLISSCRNWGESWRCPRVVVLLFLSWHLFAIMQWLMKIIQCFWRESWKCNVHCCIGEGSKGADSPCIDFSHDVSVQDGRTWTREGGREFASKYADIKTLWLGWQISSA